jgi:hypothetical protein
MIRSVKMILFIFLSILSGINSMSVNVPQHMSAAAGVDFSIEITNDFGAGSSSKDSKFDSYGTLLAISPDGSNTTAVCYLGQSYYPINKSKVASDPVVCWADSSRVCSWSWTLHELKIHLAFRTDLSTATAADFHKFQITAAVGPSGAFYSIATWDFNKLDDTCPDTELQQFEISQKVQLNGGQGEWSAFERNNHSPLEHLAENIPCGSYPCVKTCNTGNYPANVADNDPLNYESTYECIALCQGVELPSFDEFMCKSNSSSSTTVWNDHTASPIAGVTGTITVVVPTLTPSTPSKSPQPSTSVITSTLPTVQATNTPSPVVVSGSTDLKETIKSLFTGVSALVFGVLILNL